MISTACSSTVTRRSAAGQLQNGDKSAVLRTITTGDSYVPVLAAFAIDVNAPDFTGSGSKLSTSADVVKIGDKLTVTSVLENTGQVPAQQVPDRVDFDHDGVPSMWASRPPVWRHCRHCSTAMPVQASPSSTKPASVPRL